jgi:hypothetical protein
MGVLFSIDNKLVLVMPAAWLVELVAIWYLMWWRIRPTLVVHQPQRSPLMLLCKTPIAPLLLIVSLILPLGLFLPLMDIQTADFYCVT